MNSENIEEQKKSAEKELSAYLASKVQYLYHDLQSGTVPLLTVYKDFKKLAEDFDGAMHIIKEFNKISDKKDTDKSDNV